MPVAVGTVTRLELRTRRLRILHLARAPWTFRLGLVLLAQGDGRHTCWRGTSLGFSSPRRVCLSTFCGEVAACQRHDTAWTLRLSEPRPGRCASPRSALPQSPSVCADGSANTIEHFLLAVPDRHHPPQFDSSLPMPWCILLERHPTLVSWRYRHIVGIRDGLSGLQTK